MEIRPLLPVNAWGSAIAEHGNGGEDVSNSIVDVVVDVRYNCLGAQPGGAFGRVSAKGI